MINNDLLTFAMIIVGFFLVDIFCAGQGNLQSAWQIPNQNNGINSKVLQTNISTTPWPALNQRRNQSPNRNNAQQPMWVQNGSNWVRNSPMPTQVVPVPTMNSNRSPQNVPANTPRNPWQNNMNNNRNSNSNNNNRKMVQINIVGSTTSPKPPNSSQNNVNVNNNNRNQNSPVNFITSPRTPTNINNNRNNVNVNFLNNERTNVPGGIFSSGTTRGGQQNNSTINSHHSKDQNKGDVNDDELRDFSEALLSKDTNNAAKYVTINLQKMTSSRSTVDEAPLPLLTIDQAAFSIPSISKLLLLHNNYIIETNQNEVYTAQEKLEENDLLDTILPTPVMQYTRNFLIEKGKIGKDPKEFKDLLRTIWFNMYSRGGGRIGSSAFEHIFLAELKDGKVSGLHNWLYFYEEEKKRSANYLGYLKKIDLGNKGAILKYHFTLHDTDKPVGSMFIGTSPELEMAVYTTCYVLRADKICPLKMNGNRFIIRTYNFRYRGKNMIGSAFPEI